MVKFNFTKAEEAISDGVRKASVDKLLEMTELKEDSSSLQNQNRQFLKALKYELRHLTKEGYNPYEKLKINKGEFLHFLADPASITEVEWRKIKEIKIKVDQFKKELKEKISDLDIIQKARSTTINKRINVSDKWLPLK